MPLGLKEAQEEAYRFYIELYRDIFDNILLKCTRPIASSSGPLKRVFKLCP